MAKITKMYWGINMPKKCSADSFIPKLGKGWLYICTGLMPDLFKTKAEAVADSCIEDGETPVKLRVTIEEV